MSVTARADYSHTDAYAQGYDDGLRAARCPTTSEAAPFPASPARPDSTRIAGERPFADVTLLFWHRRLLRTIARGALFTAGDAPTLDELVKAGLVERDEGQWALTADGRAYLAAHDEAKTRRLPRPAPPKLPEGWRFAADLEAWVYEGRLADCVLEDPGPYDLAADLERAEAQVALLRYLRAMRAHTRAGARIDADPVEAGDAASSSPLDRGDSAGREEPS